MPSIPLRTEHCTALPADLAIIADGRRRIAEWAAHAALSADAATDLEVVTSELLANAIAASRPDAEVLVGMSRDDACVVVEVANIASPDPVEPSCWDYDDPLRAGGRGLAIVRALTESVEIELLEPWTVVRCALRLDDHG